MSSSASKKQSRKNALGARLDPGWEHGIEIDSNKKQVQCKYCGITRAGGVYRLKHHLACTHTNVEPCPSVPEDVRTQMFDLLSASSEESRKKKQRVSKMYDLEEEEGEVGQQAKKCSMDNFVVRKSGGLNVRQTTINEKWKKQDRDEVCQIMARWFYTSAIPFNAVNNPLFPLMIRKLGEYGKGLKPPSYHEMRVTFLKKEVQETLNLLNVYKKEWKKAGCTIMSDGWSDQRKRTMNNFLVNSPAGSVFLSSVDTTDISKTAQKLFELLDGIVEKIGEDNVVQVITDNASNYKAAGKILMEKRKRLFWTPCAAHCIDLMLEDFQKFDSLHKVTIQKAKSVVTYIYSWGTVINWMKQFTKGKELIRPRVTRFATSYLTMRRLSELKGNLFTFFSSDTWKTSMYVRRKKGKKIESIIFDNQEFWPNVELCLKIASPLIKVLRMVDSDEKPAMGFLYKAIDQAKEEIKQNVNNVRKRYKSAFAIIDKRWEDQLSHPLHVAGYYLNPQFQYSPDFRSDANIKRGLYDCIAKMVPESGERVHSKRRNRLAQKRMNDLVFVMYNLKLRERQRQRQRVIEEIPFENLPSDDEWVTERENPTLPRENSWLRVLDDNPECDTSDEEGNEDNEIEILTRNVQRVYDHQDRETHARRRQINKMKEIHVIDEDDGPSTEFDRQDDDYLDMVPENDVQMGTNDLDDDEDNAEDEFQENWDGEDDWENNDFDNVNYGDNQFDENDDNDWL
ncbi:uncharacterized protein LOC113780554 [Coffea eugenioides]|uniref:uncharacterized protein LOC113780554 n=1 Tax=Coffea eugenioides TaxID=49369 RepID=UPI000F60E465|nr:uncharacterized protein LOC113780554 [Coffea eugenioides]